MSGLIWTLVIASVFALLIIGRRIWPLYHGRARSDEDVAARMNRWNLYLVPMLRKHLTEQDMMVGLAGTFKSERDHREYTTATWTLEPSVMPDVDYIVLAPPTEDGIAEVVGFIEAALLRDYLEGKAQPQIMFGHPTWIYLWSDDVDSVALRDECLSPDEFMADHGLTPNEEEDLV